MSKVNERAAEARANYSKEAGPNIVETALRAGEQLAPSVVANPVQDGKPFIVLRGAAGEQTVQFLTERFEAPARAQGTVKLSDEASFIAYWKKHAGPASAIYASMQPARFLAVFDDHDKGKPDYREHRALYALTLSREWKEWEGRNRQPFEGNEKLALWLEDQVPDIVRPEGAKMLEIALNFRMNQNAAFGNAVRLQDGNTEFTFTNEVDASARNAAGSGKVKIPEDFSIEIPVFDGLAAKKYRMEARFRFRLVNGSLKLWYELIRPHVVIETAFKALLDGIEKAAKPGLVLFGSPD